MMRLRLFIALILSCPLAAIAGDTSLYDRAKRASAEVLVDRRLAGSGCAISPDGLILTAAHLFRDSFDEIEVLMNDRVRLPVKLVATDEGHDVALLQLPKQDKPIEHLSLAAEIPVPGKRAFVLGAPVFRHAVLIRGTIARRDTTFEFVDGQYVEVFHVSAIAPKGTSGGPWLNKKGEVIGVQSSAMILKDSQQGIAFAAPLAAVKSLVENKKNVPTPSIGIGVEELWEQPVDYLKKVDRRIRGVVAKVLKDAVKEKIKRDEIITTIDGQPIEYRDEFVRAVRKRAVGDKVKLVVFDREGKNRREVVIPLVALESPGR